MKKLFFFMVGALLAACVFFSCRKSSPYSPVDSEFIIAYSCVEPYDGKVNVEFPTFYNVEITSDGARYIVICDCDTKAASAIPNRTLAIPSVNALYDVNCTDRSSVAYYGFLFYDSKHEATMFFNWEER